MKALCVVCQAPFEKAWPRAGAVTCGTDCRKRRYTEYMRIYMRWYRRRKDRTIGRHGGGGT
jgi:hypothetical protein